MPDVIRADVIRMTPLCPYLCEDRVCGAVTTTTVVHACRHEHIVRAPVCAEHCAIEVRDAAAGQLMCQECWEAPGRGHACRLVAREEPGDTSIDLTGSVGHITLADEP